MMSFVDDYEDSVPVEHTAGGMLAELNRSEVDMQISTAKKYPRNLRRFMNECRSMSCLDEVTAGECFYSLPRSGKNIVGPSARFAEIAVSAWGNCHAGARVIAEDDKFIVAQGVFYDLERNVRITYEVRRRVTDKNGKRYNDDMVGVTANAACSIALRNAALKGIPKAYWAPIFDAAKTTAIGNVRSLAKSREDMVAYFGKMGITPDRIVLAVGKPSLEDVDSDDLLTLKGIATALKDGDTSIEEAFPRQAPKVAPTPGQSKSDALAEMFGKPDAPTAQDQAETAPRRRGRPPKAKVEPVAPDTTPEPETAQEEPQEDIAPDTGALASDYINRINRASNLVELGMIQEELSEDTKFSGLPADLATAVSEAYGNRWKALE